MHYITAQKIKRKAVEEKAEQVRSAKKSMALTKAADYSFAALINNLMVTLGIDGKDWSYFYHYETRQDIHMYADVDKDLGFKAPNLMAFVAAVEHLMGCEASVDSAANEYSGSKTFRFRNAQTMLEIQFSIPNDAKACRTVQVGTELKEVPKYAIQCD